VTGASNVGIRKTSPDHELDITSSTGYGAAIRVETWTLMSGDSSGGSLFANNAYREYDGISANAYKYANTHPSIGYTIMQQQGGVTTWYAATGATTEDATFAPVARMILTADGKLGTGGGTPTIDLAVADTDTGLDLNSDNVISMYTGGVERMRWDSSANVAISYSTTTASRTVGFMYISTSAGLPTGVPAITYGGRVPMVYDTTNNKMCVYNAGWKCGSVWA